MSLKILEDIDYHDGAKYTLIETLKSLSKYEVQTTEDTKILIISNLKHVSLVSETFILYFDGNKLILSTVYDNIISSVAIDNDISEGLFFQRSCIEDYDALRFEDITFVKDVYSAFF